jgi:hypothetical protein
MTAAHAPPFSAVHLEGVVRGAIQTTIAVVLLPYLEQEAAERYQATVGRPKKSSQKVDSISDRNEGKAAAVAAATVGTNRQYVADAKKLKEEDPLAYIDDMDRRRNVTKGQQAMALAMIYPEDGGKGGRGKKSETLNPPLNGKFGRERLRQARAVLQFSRPIAQAVFNGTTPARELEISFRH